MFQTNERGNLVHFAVECASSHMRENCQDASLCLRALLLHMKHRINEVDQHGEIMLLKE